jgi:hypothetical protein
MSPDLSRHAKMVFFWQESASSFAFDGIEGAAGRRGRCGCNSALNQRRRRDAHGRSHFCGQELERGLGAQQSAAQIDEHEYAIWAMDGGDRFGYASGVGSEWMFRVRHTASGRDEDPAARHLRGKCHGGFGQLSAVGNQDKRDHAAYSAIAPGWSSVTPNHDVCLPAGGTARVRHPV